MNEDRLAVLKTEDETYRTYYARRTHLMYYEYVHWMVRVFGADAKSMIDVGSSNAPYMDAFDWVDVRHAVDIRKPYTSDKVKGFEADFLSFEPEIRYDMAVCFQVLEHIGPVREFAQKLLSIADAVLISVPHMWPAGSHADHPNDPVDIEKVSEWFGRRPDHSLVVMEPFVTRKKRSRLFCYYQVAGQMKTLSELNKMYVEARTDINKK